MSADKLIALATGGTGGHLFPAEALARELLARGFRVALVTDRRGQAFGDRLAIELHRIRAGRFGAGVMSKVVGIADIALGTFEARSLLRQLTPACAVGFGGYASLPTMLAAARLNLPTVIHEQNALLGRANRLLARRVGHIATSFADTSGIRAAARRRVTLTGNPVRPAIAAERGTAYPARSAGMPFRVLVTGGSQGAHILSDIVPRALALLPEAQRGLIDLAQQARPEDLEAARRRHAESGIRNELASFFDDMPVRLANAHLVIARAGASSLAEIAAIGRPAILVPYAHAAEDHQTLNARAFAASGAAWVMAEGDFSPEALAARLWSLMEDHAALTHAAAASFAQGRPLAGRALADLVESAAGGANGDAAPLDRKDAA
jgi:UDP-N-acetylglucosamine--N-acetylmuramyl-(pentapeptide) pyrophosphoryl-undecaprenol N-acetylglucosamine transferase